MPQILPLVNRIENITEEPRVAHKPAHLSITVQTTGGEAGIEITYEAAARLASVINRQLYSRTAPFAVAPPLPAGANELRQPAEDFTATPLDGPVPAASLNIMLGIDPGLSASARTPQAATTLAIHMGQTAATRLFVQIRELARKMGWPLPKEDGSRV
jgi:hypothetical protein